MSAMTSLQGLPAIDLRATRSLDPCQRRSCLSALELASRDTGFFLVTGHSVADGLLARAQQQIEQFFELPRERKLAIHIAKSRQHRGYVPIGEENAIATPSPDFKEAFDLGREIPADDPDVIAGKPFHGPNVWPDALPEFRATLLALYDSWFAVSAQLSSLFAVCFGLPADYFAARTRKHLCELRIAKYPPLESTPDAAQMGCGEHTDYGVLSLLWQIDRPGLELLRRDGIWVRVPAVPGTLVCILGDMTSRLTNDVWRATRHRVINSGSSARHSAIFFFDPDYDCVIEPLPRFVAESGKVRYAPISMGAHMTNGYDRSFQYRSQKEA